MLKETASLDLADKVMFYLCQNLQECNTALSLRLRERLEVRVKERRDAVLYHLLHYLENPSYIYQLRDVFGEKITRKEIRYVL